MSSVLSDHRLRLPVIVVLLAALAVMFVWAGTMTPNTAMNNYPGDDEVGADPGAYTGQQVEIGGTVVATDPVVVEIRYGVDKTRHITLENLEEPIKEGQDVSAFGTLTDTDTLSVENALARSPWEAWYMYAVSLIGGLWVLGRVLTQWRPDRDRLAVVPRGDRDA